MDAKELRAEAALTERSNDGGVKFVVQYDRSKCEVGSGAFKGDTAGVRPCAVIGPDRVVLPARDSPKKPAEPWLVPDPGYRCLPDYPYKMSENKDPTRNISPRQTFQENMQRIIMPPGYNVTNLHEDPTFPSKNNKLNAPLEVKYCDVPYNINQVSSDQKQVRNSDQSSSNVNPLLMRGVPHGWPAGSIHVRPLRAYGAPEMLQYPDYANCMGTRPVLTRTHNSGHDEQLYPDAYYHEGNIRFKPYPNIKERYPQTRYEYLGNYQNPYHPPNPFTHKYELPKTIPPHSYSGYPHIPKYTERIPEPIMDGYQRTYSQQGNYAVPIRNPVIHSPYRPVPGNHMQNKLHPYPPDGQLKPVPNKLPYDPASKMGYLDYDSRAKPNDNYYLNELPRSYHPKSTIVLPNFPPANIHGQNAHPCFPLKNYDYTRYKNIDPSMINHSLTKLPPQFSPSTLAISPADSNASNETAQTHGTSQEDCGYASQSSVTSVRSIESLNRMPMDAYGRYDYRYSPMIRAAPSTKPGPSSNQGSKSKKDIRQFISSWSEGDDENPENSAKKDGAKAIPDEKQSFKKQNETVNNHEQLYVLGLVNVPSEELSKYEHIQKVSKLPENIKGYNSLELLNQFEEAIESSNITSVKPPTPRTVQLPVKRMVHKYDPLPRALSPLDVEAKISQSVIHKEVGCNFEIKPCSPKMLNVEVAAPMQTLLNERVIEKVSNPHSVKSPIILQNVDEKIENTLINKTMKCPVPNTASSCKMINSQHLSESSGIDHLKTNYSLQDLESNSGVCLASLPRLDNDIELNFPEVNQQFINANKTESVINRSLAKDLPALDMDRPAITSTEYDTNYQFSPKTETETDFSKLSKYRKLKRCVTDDNDSVLAKAQATRVDSVIIKNPENTRSIEENIENTNSEGDFRNDFQEYAMNLVSQTKHTKGNHQQDVDKILGTSTSPDVNSRYENLCTHSPNSLTINQSSNLHNIHLEVIEETSPNYHSNVHAQSDDFSIHSKDLSSRYLEKSVLDIPMNLSPQARYSAIGVDEEIRHSTIGEKPATFDGKLQCAVVTCLKKNDEVEPKCSSDMNLDKIEGSFIKSQSENVIEESDNQCPDILEKSITKPDIYGNCSRSRVKKPDDLSIGKDDHLISRGNNHSHVNVMCSKEEKSDAFEIKQLDGLNENMVTGEVNRGHNFFDHKKVLGGSQSTVISNDEIDNLHKQHDTLKKYDRYVSKLKRKRIKRETSHRKRSVEKRLANVVDRDNREQDLNVLSKSKEENPIKKTDKEPHIIPDKVSAENNIKTDSTLNNEFIVDNDKDLTITSNLGAMTVQSTTLQMACTYKKCMDENNGTGENISPNCPDVIKKNNSFSCLPANDKYSEILSVNETNATAQNNVPIDFNSVATKHTENCNEFNLEDQVVSRESHTNDALIGTMPDYQTEQEKSSTHENASINLDTKEFDTQLFSDRFGTKSKENDASHENEDVNMKVFPDFKQKLIETTKSSEILNFEQDTVEQIERIRKESNALPSIIIETKELSERSKDMQNCEDLEIIPPKYEDCYQDIPMFNTEDNSITKGVTNTRSCSKKIGRPYINKELFSSRFQNLLLCNEIINMCSGAGKTKIGETQLNLEKKVSEAQNQIICAATVATRLNTVKVFTKINNREKVSELSDCDEPNKIRQANTTLDCNKEEKHVKTDDETTEEECCKERLSKEMDAATAKKCAVSSDCKENEIYIRNSFPSLELPIKIPDESQIETVDNSLKKSIGNYVTQSSCEEVFNNCEKDFEDTAESEDCTTNIIVINETTSVLQEHCHELSEISAPVVNNYELNKKIQSFVQNARPRFSLKRSLSDSALSVYDDEFDDCSEKSCFMLPKKRKKATNIGKIEESHLLKIIQSSRRNSISTLDNENFSFCILIDDNCIVEEENYEQENFVPIEDDLQNHALKNPLVGDENIASPMNLVDQNEKGQHTNMPNYDEEKAWVEDVGCEETIETEDIAENIVIGSPASPKDADLSDYESDDEEMDILSSEAVDHTSKVKHIYGDNMCTNDAQLVDALYRTPQMDVNKKLMDRESHINEKGNKYYDSYSLEMLLAEPVDTIPHATGDSNVDNINVTIAQGSTTDLLNKKNKESACLQVCPLEVSNLLTNVAIPNENITKTLKIRPGTISYDETEDRAIHSCESSLDNVLSYIHKGSQTTSSSPEVSSTTSEEKKSSILLKISKFEGSRISEVKSLTLDMQKENSCKLEGNEYLKPNYSDGMSSNRPLRTKAAQKYIPPLRESIPDLKVKLALPQQSLLKFQKNKVAKEEPKLSTCNLYSNIKNKIKLQNEIPRKIKPKFEDVLKNIDEAQFQMHKEKNKKAKKYIPKVVIKKTENGSHYASTSTKQSFNPDLTGRKWQPWVFIEKNKFIDDMALRNKTRAVFSHRRKSFVLAEKFCKYKSISTAKFTMSQHKVNNYSTGNLKYTIKLKQLLK